MPMQDPKIVKYKGREYRMTYCGPTKYGERAKLEFLNGEKSWWTDVANVEVLRDDDGTKDEEPPHPAEDPHAQNDS